MTILASLLLFAAAAPIVAVGAVGEGVPGEGGKAVTNDWSTALSGVDECKAVPRALPSVVKLARLRSCRGDVSCLDSASRDMGFDAVASLLVTKATKGLAITAQLLVSTGAPPRFFTATAANEAGLAAAYRGLAAKLCAAHLSGDGAGAASLELDLEEPVFELPAPPPPIAEDAPGDSVPSALPPPSRTLGLATAAPPPRVNPFTAPAARPAARGSSRAPVVVAVGVAVLSAAAGGFFGYSTLAAARERDQVSSLSEFTQRQGDAEFFSLLTNVAWGVAGASTIAGGIFLATSGPAAEATDP